jgi:putative transposase
MSPKLTYRFRIKDKHAARLSAQARAVNFVWNYCNEVQRKAVEARRPWFTANALGRLCAGATKEGLDLSANTVEQICRQYDRSRRLRLKPWLRWRSVKSLGWIPVRDGHMVFRDGAFWFRRERYDAWVTRRLSEGQRFGISHFSQDARGRWYVNVTVEAPIASSDARGAVGVDLGLKSLATLSDGRAIKMPAYFRKAERSIASAQRARKPRLVVSRRARVANQRRDYLHKASSALAKEYGLIVVGNVSPSKLARTNMAKSVLDAGWSDFRQMIAYKAITHGAIMLEVDEANTTRACAECGSIAGPEGRAGLRIREWKCSDCGAVHDRDVNAARNILRLGLQALAGGAVKAERPTERREFPTIIACKE